MAEQGASVEVVAKATGALASSRPVGGGTEPAKVPGALKGQQVPWLTPSGQAQTCHAISPQLLPRAPFMPCVQNCAPGVVPGGRVKVGGAGRCARRLG